MTQAEEGMKLFEAQQGTAAEVDKVRGMGHRGAWRGVAHGAAGGHGSVDVRGWLS